MPQRQPAFHTECLSSPPAHLFRQFLSAQMPDGLYTSWSHETSAHLSAQARYPAPQGFLHLTGYAGDYALSYACDGHTSDRPTAYVPAQRGIEPDRRYH